MTMFFAGEGWGEESRKTSAQSFVIVKRDCHRISVVSLRLPLFLIFGVLHFTDVRIFAIIGNMSWSITYYNSKVFNEVASLPKGIRARFVALTD